MDSEIIQLAFAFDENFINPFYVLLTSIFLNNKEHIFQIHTITTGVPQKQKDRIRRFVHLNKGTITFYDLQPEHLKGLAIPKTSTLTSAAYYRLFFHLVVPEHLTKLLYMDCDIVVIGNLGDLYNTDLGTYPFGAVAQSSVTKNRPDLGIDEIGIYFNSGVMLMNIPEWKSQKITEKSLAFLHDFPEKTKLVDQDALNVASAHYYFHLAERFNVLPSIIPKNQNRQNYYDFLKDKVIMHYTWKDCKPWSFFSLHPYNQLYKFYFKKSPQAREEMYVDFKVTPGFLYRVLRTKSRLVGKRLSLIK
jgi:lipopolysaccharide biosynthesis glycosyltransferase